MPEALAILQKVQHLVAEINVNFGRAAIIDLDDTLGALREVLAESLSKEVGQPIDWRTWKHHHISDSFGISQERFLEMLIDGRLLETMPPHSEARDFMSGLGELGVRRIILTARGWHPRAKDITESWLNAHGIPYDEVLTCSLTESKAEYIQRMEENVLFTVDDSASHCNGYASLKSKKPDFIFAYEMPWTRHHLNNECIVPIGNLNEIFDYIK